MHNYKMSWAKLVHFPLHQPFLIHMFTFLVRKRGLHDASRFGTDILTHHPNYKTKRVVLFFRHFQKKMALKWALLPSNIIGFAGYLTDMPINIPITTAYSSLQNTRQMRPIIALKLKSISLLHELSETCRYLTQNANARLLILVYNSVRCSQRTWETLYNIQSTNRPLLILIGGRLDSLPAIKEFFIDRYELEETN